MPIEANFYYFFVQENKFWREVLKKEYNLKRAILKLLNGRNVCDSFVNADTAHARGCFGQTAWAAFFQMLSETLPRKNRSPERKKRKCYRIQYLFKFFLTNKFGNILNSQLILGYFTRS